MNEDQLAEQLKYSSPKEIYVVTYRNKLVLLVCPFRVKVLNPVGALRKNDMVEVEEIRVTLQLVTVFMIRGKAYYYFHFDFIV